MRSIGHNKGTETPSLLFFFDTDTYCNVNANKPQNRNLTFRLAVGIEGRLEQYSFTRRHVHRFDRPEAIWKRIVSLSNPHRPVWVFAHNLCFDLTISRFWDALESGIFRINSHANNDSVEKPDLPKRHRGSIVIGPKPTFMKLFTEKGKVILVDTFNYLPMSLARIGESMQLPKYLLPAFSDDDDRWFEYCER